MITRNRIHRRCASDFGGDNEKLKADCTATAAISTGKLLLTCTQPIVVRDVPTTITVNGEAPTAAECPTPTTVLLTYAVPVAAGQSWVIGNKEPHIRTAAGGFIAAAGGTFPA